MADEPFKYVFGPVPSRRLGRSLGIDLVPFKTCTYNCVYCQLGVTATTTLDRKEYVPLDEVLAELDRKLATGASPDYITLAGSGEPTLYSRLRELISGIKARTAVPVAVITNGALLYDLEVQDALLEADVLAPSLDAPDADSFERVNRPHPSIRFEQMVEGLVKFRARFHHQLWLEVFLLEGITATEEHVRRLAGFIDRIRPDRVQLNTVARPPAEKSALAVSPERMAALAAILGDKAEVIAEFDYTQKHQGHPATKIDVLDMVTRHPCSLDDIVEGLGIDRKDATKHLTELQAERALSAETRGNRIFYFVRMNGG